MHNIVVNLSTIYAFKYYIRVDSMDNKIEELTLVHSLIGMANHHQ